MASLIRPRVLILTNEKDVSVDWVVRRLRSRRIPYLRLNTERLPNLTFGLDPIAASWLWVTRGERFLLDDVGAVWYRRPERPILEGSTLSLAEQRYVADQWDGLVRGLSTLPAQWMNEPHRGQRAESKILQLFTARSSGFRVPATLVTNNRSEALDFISSAESGAVVKAVASSLIDEPTEPSFVFTHLATPDLVQESDDRDLSPFMLQHRLQRKRDVRVTVVGPHVLAAELDVSDGPIDWRLSDNREFRHHALPDFEQEACRHLVQTLGLWFGAIDLAVNEDGYWFLELNQNGEWGWLEETVGLPIADTIVEELLSATSEAK